MYEFEKNKLYSYLGEDLINQLKKHKVFIAGGAITSLFCNRDINDIDIYFRDESSLLSLVEEFWDDNLYIVSHTKKATQYNFSYMKNDIPIQLIHFKYFNSPEDIFKTFDYTVCMGCFDFNTEEFVLHDDFLKHNSQRLLKFNSDTAYPIVSLLRVQKYEKRGYVISKPEFIRIILTCMNTEINSYEELKDQIGGMYGMAYEKLFEDIEDNEFDLSKAIDKIADISKSEDYFKQPIGIEFNDIEELIDSISKNPRDYMEINDVIYIINYKGVLREKYDKPVNGNKINPYEYFRKNKMYKFVKKNNGKYYSHYDNNFEYTIGREVVANGNSSDRFSHIGNLHLCPKNNLNNTYKNYNDSVLIELEINPEHLSSVGEHVLAKKAFVIREVPEEEWEQW